MTMRSNVVMFPPPKEVDADYIWFSLTGTHIDRRSYRYMYFTELSGCRIKGMAVYCDYNGDSCTMHLYGPGLVTRDNIKRGLQIPLIEWKVNRIFIEIRASHDKEIHFMYRMGFKKAASIEHRYDTEDMLVFVANREDLDRWVK